jgi:excisionase family DNA binding protein
MPEAPRSRDALSRVSKKAFQLSEVEELHRKSAADLSQAMYDARQEGHTWTEIAMAAGLDSPKTARSRAERSMDVADLSPSVRWRRERGRAPRPKETPPGLSVTEAAAHLGVTRRTIYNRIANGKLITTTDESGRTRVILDD